MVKIKFLSFVFILSMLCAMMVPATALAEANLHVGEGYQYGTINAAIAASNEGDTIIVHEGTYSELVDITENNITLIGVGAIIDGSDFPDERDGLITIFSAFHKITIKGFEICNFTFGDHGGNGIFVQNDSYGNTIINNYIHDVNGAGIFLAENSSGNLISRNYISDSENGVGTSYSHNNKILNNITKANNIGIFLSHNSSNNIIKGNRDSGSNCGINLGGVINTQVLNNQIINSPEGILLGSDDSLNSSRNNTINRNTIRGSTSVGIYLGNAYNNRILNNTIIGTGEDNGARGIVLGQDDAGVSPSFNTIKGNCISNFNAGIALFDAANKNLIQNNWVMNSAKVGISLIGVNNNIIKSNRVYNSGNVGIAVRESSSYNIIIMNTVNNSGLLDLSDDLSGVNNIWRNNKYNTANF